MQPLPTLHPVMPTSVWSFSSLRLNYMARPLKQRPATSFSLQLTLCMLRLTHALVAPNRLYGAPADMNPDLPLLADSSRPMASLVIANSQVIYPTVTAMSVWVRVCLFSLSPCLCSYHAHKPVVTSGMVKPGGLLLRSVSMALTALADRHLLAF
jgi:hypothetical protein